MNIMTLQEIWFFLWGLLWAAFFMTSGFDLGIGAMLPFMAKNDDEKKIMINSMGPFWDGNEVWLISAGGVTFAAFPIVYSVMFSSLYSALMLILFALILRGVSIEFRNKLKNKGWRQICDACIFIGSAATALLFGVAFANIFQGLPLDQNRTFQGNILTLLNGYGLLGGLLFLILFIEHGLIWLSAKTEGKLHERAVSFGKSLWYVELIAVILFLGMSAYKTTLFQNYKTYPILFAIILIAVIGIIGILVFLNQKKYYMAWFSSALTIVCATFFGIAGLFPNLLPSCINNDYSLTAYNSSSSQLTLTIMLVVVLLFVPVVISYQIWVYWLFKDKVTMTDIAENY